MRRNRGNLLIELSVAIGVAIAGISATLARVQSTSKTGREIELMNQAVSDGTGFAAYATNLHLMGGPNFVGNTSTVGDISTEYLQWLQRNYPVNNMTATATGTVAAGTATFNGYIWQLGSGLGTNSAVGDQTLVPAAGAELYFVQGVETTNSQMGVVYMHGQAPLAKSTGAATAGVVYTAAGNTVYGSATGAASNAANPVATLVQTGSRQAEAVQVSLAEDPNTGIVTVVTPFNFTSVNLATAVPAVGTLFTASGLTGSGLIANPGAQGQNTNQPLGF